MPLPKAAGQQSLSGIQVDGAASIHTSKAVMCINPGKEGVAGVAEGNT